MKECVVLEPAAKEVCINSAKCPLIFQLPPKQGRLVLEEAQSSPIVIPPVSICTITDHTRSWGNIPLYLVSTIGLKRPKGVIFYIHGAGWVFGSFHTHRKLVCELACRTGCLVIFPEYSRAPEAQYPVALEQCYAVLEHLPRVTKEAGFGELDFSTLTVAGDSVGGNMATIMTFLSKLRNGPFIQKQLLYYPVTNACFETCSYQDFACDYYLYRAGMMWFWNQYLPDISKRCEITASPLQASLSQLKGLPQAMIINGEADVLRDEGEQYADKLRKAGVDVTQMRVQGTIHDFVMLNALDQTDACRIAMDASVAWINRKNMAI